MTDVGSQLYGEEEGPRGYVEGSEGRVLPSQN